ncbi:hypothetical protein [Endozoicomonas lisbonensis]|uniref:Lipoprotein n=1 Tax=Endozoicomonas lisbonensis TaxID=3120522 RepID=A0ABV2SD06_9GAMM
MIKSFLPIATAVFLLTGCATTSQNNNSSAENAPKSINENQCHYNNMPGAEFIYVGTPKYFSLYFEGDNGYLGKSDIGTKLKGKKFKFSGNLAQEKSYQKKYRKILNINGNDIQFDSNVKTAVLFENCETALWFKGHVNYDRVQNEDTFIKVDGQPFNVNDLAYAYGTNNVKPAEYKANIEIDGFAKRATIKTEFQDKVMLRAWSDSKMKTKPNEFQVYVDLGFLGDWGHITSARTRDGNKYSVTKINTDVDCSGNLGCYLTETVGVSLPISFLEENKNGFDIKFYGMQQREVKISGYHVKSLLQGLEQIKI